MIGRELASAPIRRDVNSALNNGAKTQRPELSDAGYFGKLAKAEKPKVAVNNDSLQADELQQPIDNVEVRQVNEAIPSQLPFQSLLLNAGIALTEPQRKTGGVGSLLDEKQEAQLYTETALAGVRKGTIYHQPNFTKTDLKTISGNFENHGQKPDLATKKAQQILVKSPIELPDFNMVKQGSEVEIMPALAVPLTPVNALPLQSQTARVYELANVTRINLEHTKRNSAGTLTSLELVLEPAELGRISAKLQHEEGRITLILTAEHKLVADDLARDGGLLMRVIGDHIPGIERMAVFVQAEGAQTVLRQSQNFGDLGSGQNGKGNQGGLSAATLVGEDIAHDLSEVVKVNTTSFRVLI